MFRRVAVFFGVLAVAAGGRPWNYADDTADRTWSFRHPHSPKQQWTYNKDYDGDQGWRLIYPSPTTTTTSTTTTTTTTPPPTTTTEEATPAEEIWTYTASEDPMTWPCLYRGCRGANQSPINIDTEAIVVNTSLTPIIFNNMNAPLQNLTIQNTGYDFNIRIPASANITATADWLPDTYRLNAIYFYWSNTSGRGSQHTVDSKYFPMEAILVFLKNEYTTLVDRPDAVLAVSVLFKIKPYDNDLLNPLFDSLATIIYPGTGIITSIFRVRSLLPYDTSSFVRYTGSAHAPPCFEGWTWIVYHHANSISESQIGILRQLRSSAQDAAVETFITNNARPIQPLNDRIIETTAPPTYHQKFYPPKVYTHNYEWQ